jgi:hypothetical protein
MAKNTGSEVVESAVKVTTTIGYFAIWLWIIGYLVGGVTMTGVGTWLAFFSEKGWKYVKDAIVLCPGNCTTSISYTSDGNMHGSLTCSDAKFKVGNFDNIPPSPDCVPPQSTHPVPSPPLQSNHRGLHDTITGTVTEALEKNAIVSLSYDPKKPSNIDLNATWPTVGYVLIVSGLMSLLLALILYCFRNNSTVQAFAGLDFIFGMFR